MWENWVLTKVIICLVLRTYLMHFWHKVHKGTYDLKVGPPMRENCWHRNYRNDLDCMWHLEVCIKYWRLNAVMGNICVLVRCRNDAYRAIRIVYIPLSVLRIFPAARTNWSGYLDWAVRGFFSVTPRNRRDNLARATTASLQILSDSSFGHSTIRDVLRRQLAFKQIAVLNNVIWS
jgi:hypothetical protein